MDEEGIREIAQDEAQNPTRDAVAGEEALVTEDEEPNASQIEEVGEAPVESEKQATIENRCADIVPMTDWVGGGDRKECRPCLLPPVIQWYRDELRANGLVELAAEVEGSAETNDPVAITQKFDEIKSRVPEDLKQRLREFDCAVQLYRGVEERKDGEPEEEPGGEPE